MEENRKKILVVEDEKFARDILNFTLSSEDYDISLAEDGLEALNKASSNNYDLIIMDVMMPNIDGYEACRRLKANEITKSIPIILLTGRAQKGDILKGVQAGADDYLLKPYKLQIGLINILARAPRCPWHKPAIIVNPLLLSKSPEKEKKHP